MTVYVDARDMKAFSDVSVEDLDRLAALVGLDINQRQGGNKRPYYHIGTNEKLLQWIAHGAMQVDDRTAVTYAFWRETNDGPPYPGDKDNLVIPRGITLGTGDELFGDKCTFCDHVFRDSEDYIVADTGPPNAEINICESCILNIAILLAEGPQE